MSEPRKKIALFLKKFKRNAEINGIKFWHREKNWDVVLKDLNFTKKNLEKYIMDLVPGDCSEEPKRDTENKGIVCVFKIWLCYQPQKEIYIRLMIPFTNSQKFAICQSFKFSQYLS